MSGQPIFLFVVLVRRFIGEGRSLAAGGWGSGRLELSNQYVSEVNGISITL